MSEEPENKEFDIKNWCKHFLPALLALIVALTGWISSQTNIQSSDDNNAVIIANMNNEISNLKLEAAETKGELKSQRDLLTELRMDIREIKTILERNLEKR